MNADTERQLLRGFFDSLDEEPFDTAIILGSGLGALVDRVECARSIAYERIPGFPEAGVAGHGGGLVLGEMAGTRVAVFQGRFHMYEGYSARRATIPVRLASALGCRRLLLSCAAGGVRSDFAPGDFMLVDDHLNLTGDNPLRGESDEPFIDLSNLYRLPFADSLQRFAGEKGIRLHRGVLAALLGPSYETPAEIRMVERLGGHAVSMSTVPEAVMAAYLGMEVAAVALISNMAAGLSAETLAHRDVLDRGRQSGSDFCTLAGRLIDLWRDRPAPTPRS